MKKFQYVLYFTPDTVAFTLELHWCHYSAHVKLGILWWGIIVAWVSEEMLRAQRHMQLLQDLQPVPKDKSDPSA